MSVNEAVQNTSTEEQHDSYWDHYETIDHTTTIGAKIIKHYLKKFLYYIVIIDNNSQNMILDIELSVNSPELLEGLFNYFKPVSKDISNVTDYSKYDPELSYSRIAASRQCHLPNMIYYTTVCAIEEEHYETKSYKAYVKAINKFVKENVDKKYTKEMVVKFLTLFSKRNVTDKNNNIDNDKVDYYVKKQLSYFNNKGNKIDGLIDLCKYFIPTIIDLTDIEIKFVNNKLPISAFMYVNNDDLIKIMYKIYYIYFKNDTIKDKDVKIKDYAPIQKSLRTKFGRTARLSDMTFFVDTLKANKKDIIENLHYINELTITQFEKIVNNVEIKYNHDNFVKLAEMYKDIILTEEYFDEYNKTIKELLDNYAEKHGISDEEKNEINRKHLDKNFYHHCFWSDSTLTIDKCVNISKYDENISSYYNTMLNTKINKDFMDYVINNKDTFNFELLINMRYINCFINDGTVGFYKLDYQNKNIYHDGELHMGGYILDQLKQKMSYEQLFELLEEIKILDSPLSLEQWENYINNYEEYKKLPTSWWIGLI